ncbi:MAG TPA: hypothetical protein PKO12_08350, partial [Holophaga sp.]|nr:hypothetical protein [Holophaga sp.]
MAAAIRADSRSGARLRWTSWEARALIEKTRSRLAGMPDLSVHAVPIGAMIEVPAVVLSLE